MSQPQDDAQDFNSPPTVATKPSWPIPSQDAIKAALAAIYRKQPEQVCLTLTFKLLTRSRRKEAALLRAQRYATNMTAAILERLRVDPVLVAETHHKQQYGAFQLLVDMLDAKEQKTKKGTDLQVLAGMLSSKYKTELSPKAFPLTGTLREGVYKECSRILLAWYQKILIYKIGPLPKFVAPSTPLQAADLYQHWSNQWSIYNTAAATIIPYGRYKDEQLQTAGKRAVRWLRERLPEPTTIDATLEQLDILLNQERYKPTDIQKAKQAKHPWRRIPKRPQAVRALRGNQQIFDPQRPLIRLGLLDRKAWMYLRDELLELQQFSEKFDEIRQAVEIFLNSRPPSYPAVYPVPIDEAQQALQQHKYDTTLSWFRSAFPSKATFNNILEYDASDLAELENSARAEFLAAAHSIMTEKLQPLSFPRAIRPPSWSTKSDRFLTKWDAFALLYNNRTFEYILAVNVDGASTKQPTTINIRDHLYYINFPETPFELTEQTSIMLFPLECGEKYHELQFLRPAIERQRLAQQQRYADQPQDAATLQAIEDCLPKGIINSARLTSERNEKGYHDFYIHVSIRIPTPGRPAFPEHIIGFHEHQTGYSYAVINLRGEEVACGELVIPDHVLLDQQRGTYSDNYVYEVAHAMLRLATTHDALIAVEDAIWKRNASISRGRNRQQYGRPRKKLIDVLKYKAPLKGLAPAWSTSDVSPTRDCGQCRNRLTKGMNGVQKEYFSCHHCQTRRSSHENTALVVARRTLEQLDDHYKWLQSLG